MKAKRISTDDTFDKLIKQIRSAKDKMNEFEEENEELLATHKNLQDTITGLQERLKIEARKLSTQGTTKVLFESPDLFVQVQGKESRTFNLDAIKKKWPSSIVESVIVESIDGKVVDSLVESGKLSESEVQRVVKFEAATPAVTIRLS